MVRRMLRSLGLVRVGRLTNAEERVRKAEARSTKQAHSVEEAREEARAWRQKFEKAREELPPWKQRVEEAQKALKREEHARARDSERFEKVKSAFGRRAIDVEALQKRLAETERELVVAREHLMAVEVKLDILEGAANVLDARTRAVVTRVSTENAPGV